MKGTSLSPVVKNSPFQGKGRNPRNQTPHAEGKLMHTTTKTQVQQKVTVIIIITIKANVWTDLHYSVRERTSPF